MKFWPVFIFLFSLCSFGQIEIKTDLVATSQLKADRFVSADNFGTVYSVTNNTFYKTFNNKSLNYSNIQLGSISSIDNFNPLKMNLFYKDFNTVLILDNRLAEVSKIDFNAMEHYKNVTHVSTGSDNTIWLFNQDTQRLELYDYRINKTRAQTLPISSKILEITSNYNSCWVLTESHLLEYNYTGSLLRKAENRNFTSFVQNNNKIVLRFENKLYLFDENLNDFKLILIPNLLINQFFATNEIVYIYAENKLYQYQFKID